MKELVIISGKGGTGKTSLTAAFASLAKNSVLCDADVDASDLHLILTPDIRERHEYRGSYTAHIRLSQCTQCNLCRELCRWDAISESFEVDDIACEGCGVCRYFCPEKAIDFKEDISGEWYVSDTRLGTMVHARLGIAQENSGKMVTIVRKRARQIAEEKNLDLILTDGPPGTGCPVIASIGGADGVLIVTEPTVSGRHDMERVAALAEHFSVPVMVCINKFDLNPDKADEIEAYSKEKGIVCVGKIPFDPIFSRAITNAMTIFECDAESAVADAIRDVWAAVPGLK